MLEAQSSLGADLDVSFVLATDPAVVYRGRIKKVAVSAEADDNNEANVSVIVEFDRSQVPSLRPGASVLPKVYCGRRSIGYVWLHNLIDAIRTKVLF